MNSDKLTKMSLSKFDEKSQVLVHFYQMRKEYKSLKRAQIAAFLLDNNPNLNKNDVKYHYKVAQRICDQLVSDGLIDYVKDPLGNIIENEFELTKRGEETSKMLEVNFKIAGKLLGKTFLNEKWQESFVAPVGSIEKIEDNYEIKIKIRQPYINSLIVRYGEKLEDRIMLNIQSIVLKTLHEEVMFQSNVRFSGESRSRENLKQNIIMSLIASVRAYKDKLDFTAIFNESMSIIANDLPALENFEDLLGEVYKYLPEEFQSVSKDVNNFFKILPEVLNTMSEEYRDDSNENTTITDMPTPLDHKMEPSISKLNEFLSELNMFKKYSQLADNTLNELLSLIMNSACKDIKDPAKKLRDHFIESAEQMNRELAQILKTNEDQVKGISWESQIDALAKNYGFNTKE